MWPINFYTEVKDSLFFIGILIMEFCIFKMIKYDEKYNNKNWIVFAVSICLVNLFRNNGIYIILITLPFLVLILKKRNKLKVVGVILVTIILCSVMQKGIIKYNDIKSGNIAEALSIIIQQTSRYVVTYDITDEEKEIIEKIVLIEDIKDNYNPETVDYVKAKVKSNIPKEDLKDYFTIWFKMFLKHPGVYFTATCNSVYGYFYPDKMEYKDGVAKFNMDILENINISNFNIHENYLFANVRKIVTGAVLVIRNMPFICLLFNCGTYTWILLIVSFVLLYYKKLKELVCLVPLYVVLLVCIASPVNAFMAFVFPFRKS